MTRKVTLTALALACAALLAPGGAAAKDGIKAGSRGQTLHSAAFGPLTGSSGRRFALRLARQAGRGHKARWWQLGPGFSISPGRVTFPYADRSRDNVYCTSAIVVEQPSPSLRRAFFTGGTKCSDVPSEALAIERATARFIRHVSARAADIYEARDNVSSEVFACDRVRVPLSRRADVRTLFDTYEAFQLGGLLSAPINALITDLRKINPQRAALAPAAQRFTSFDDAGFRMSQTLIAPGEGTEARDHPCRAIRRWAAAGWTSQSSPVSFGELRSELAQMAAAERGLVRVGKALAALGVSPRAALAFTPAGVLEVAAPPRPIVCAAGAQVGCPGPG